MKKILLTTLLGFGWIANSFADNSGYYLSGCSDCKVFDKVFAKTKDNLKKIVESHDTSKFLSDISSIINEDRIRYIDIRNGKISCISLGFFSNKYYSDMIIRSDLRLRTRIFKDNVEKLWEELNNMFYARLIRVKLENSGITIAVYQGYGVFSGAVFLRFSCAEDGKFYCNEVEFCGETNKKYKL